MLHPRCILPAKQYAIPLTIHATQFPELEGTVITTTGGDGGARVKAVCIKKGITLVAMETLGMWHQVGFLADAFAVFKEHGLSVDLVSTSETSVTVSLDPAANALDDATLEALMTDLSRLCRVELIGPCAAGEPGRPQIRAILHRLGDALELFEEQKIYLVTQAANDLNLTFVVDEEQGDRLVRRLHELIVERARRIACSAPPGSRSTGRAPRLPPAAAVVEDRREELIAIARERGSAYVYDRDTLELAALSCSHPRASTGLLRDQGQPAPGDPARVRGPGPLVRVRVARRIRARADTVPGIDPRKVLFTPNFRARAGVRLGAREGVNRVTLDNLNPLREWGELFRGATCSCASTPATAADTTTTCAPRARIRSSVYRCSSSTSWSACAEGGLSRRRPARAHRQRRVRRAQLAGSRQPPRRPRAALPRVPYRPRRRPRRAGEAGPGPVDLAALQGVIAELRGESDLQLWIEPGRFLVAQAGVLLAQVTQTQGQGRRAVRGRRDRHELADPAGALRRAPRDREPDALWRAGHRGLQRGRPDLRVGRSLRLRVCCRRPRRATCCSSRTRAYGRAMSSWYNLREPAVEVLV